MLSQYSYTKAKAGTLTLVEQLHSLRLYSDLKAVQGTIHISTHIFVAIGNCQTSNCYKFPSSSHGARGIDTK